MTQPLYYEYAVQPGETITTIIHKLYGWSPPTRRYGEILEAIKALNPEVPNLHSLWPGTVLRVSDRAPSVLVPPGTPVPERLARPRRAPADVGHGLGAAQRLAAGAGGGGHGHRSQPPERGQPDSAAPGG